ncbi:MAG: hypothetical protein P4L42_03845 [Desulfocapsaceae bacterium]|nr:hypothetical protein [Desulfocapsaceae bacterium]
MGEVMRIAARKFVENGIEVAIIRTVGVSCSPFTEEKTSTPHLSNGRQNIEEKQTKKETMFVKGDLQKCGKIWMLH